MVERLYYLTSGVVLSALVLLLAWRTLQNPVQQERAWLTQELQNIPPTLEIEEAGSSRPGIWQAGILSKKGLWEGLVEPPPPPPPPGPKAPTPPDLKKLLAGVRASKRTVGQKVFMIWPGNIKGDYVGVGETIQGCTVKAIDDDFVTFSLFWKEGNKEILLKVKKERGRLN